MARILFLTHFAAQAAILYCALTIGRQCTVGISELATKDDVVKRCGLYALYYVLVEVPLLCGLQFTTTAFLATQAGIFLLLLAWQRRAQSPAADAQRSASCCDRISRLWCVHEVGKLRDGGVGGEPASVFAP